MATARRQPPTEDAPAGPERRPLLRAVPAHPGLAQQRATAATAIMAALRRSILDLSLPPGAPLIEKLLTQQFGVSRTPVREALIRLSEEGLVEIFPQSGTIVGRIPVDALPEAVVVRQALEAAAVALAVAKASDQDLDRLDAVIARQQAMASIDDRKGFHAADEAFHETLAEVGGHRGLWRVVQAAKAQIDRCRLLTLPIPGRMLMAISEHREVMQALRARNETVALAAMKRHLSALVPDVVTLRQDYPGYFI
ncbi:MAG: GntR family transcriptional regulator [Hyphomicrobiales bacterium]|jgi:DNA-binding GntR family transcriptional regulator|nr:GntR family transcriptional regulator [Hyphomicrobiales bacterium]